MAVSIWECSDGAAKESEPKDASLTEMHIRQQPVEFDDPWIGMPFEMARLCAPWAHGPWRLHLVAIAFGRLFCLRSGLCRS